MVELTQEEKNGLEKIFNEIMMNGGLMTGRYDAKNGDETFMDGLLIGLEYFASYISDDFYDGFDAYFINNMLIDRTIEEFGNIRKEESQNGGNGW